ncbi:MAG TPA: substrate-binding domain-containing protein [Burkholderiaceae bacterium]
MSAKVVLVAAAIALLGACAAPPPVQKSPAEAVREGERLVPPWQHGANNDAIKRGLEFTVPQVDVLADFHGDLADPKLVLYVGGNYFFALAPLVEEFEEEHPEFKGRIYWETIPPGMLVEQIKAGGTITSGNMTWTIKGDAYFAGLNAVKGLVDQGLLDGPAVPYVTNTLAIMVAKDNPHGIAGLADLAKPDLRLAMPNPKYEGIARQIKSSLEKAGGESLAHAVYDTKVADGSAVLTFIHHRQTPLFLMQGVADAGVVWQSEAMFQEQAGNPIGHVDIPAAQNSTEIYAGAVIHGAAHPEAARLWLDYIHSPPALAIFERYGFHAYRQ